MAVNLVNAVTINRISLYQGQPGTSFATAYTVPASTTTKIASIVVTNTTTSSATLTVSVTPSGGTASAANQIFSAYPIAAKNTISLDSAIFMNAGDFIAVAQGTSSALTVTISGETYA